MMRHKKDYSLLYPLISVETVDEKTQVLVKAFEAYYTKHPSHEDIDVSVFLPAFKRWFPKMKQETFNEYVGVIRNVWAKEPDDDVRANLINDFSELKLMTEAANYAEKYALGELPNAFMLLSTSLDEFRRRTGIKGTSFISEDIGSILQDEFDESGIEWRLSCLRHSMRGLRPGDFIIVAARPDKGKTSFIASETTHMAPQLPAERNILWLNNEGPGRRIIPRIYQAALDVNMSGLKQAYADGSIKSRFEQSVGRTDKFRVFDIHGWHVSQVERVIEANNAGIVIWDMIDNVKGFGDAPRTDLVLEHMYQHARELSVKYDLASIATSQISADGDGLQFPTQSMLKDSKTGKQGACDAIVMIGSSNAPELVNSRYIGLPKNKLRRVDGRADPRAEVIFDGLRSRYRDVEEGS